MEPKMIRSSIWLEEIFKNHLSNCGSSRCYKCDDWASCGLSAHTNTASWNLNYNETLQTMIMSNSDLSWFINIPNDLQLWTRCASSTVTNLTLLSLVSFAKGYWRDVQLSHTQHHTLQDTLNPQPSSLSELTRGMLCESLWQTSSVCLVLRRQQHGTLVCLALNHGMRWWWFQVCKH